MDMRIYILTKWHMLTQGGVSSHCGLAIYSKKYLKTIQIFHHAKIHLIFKKSSKRNQNASRIITLYLNLKFEHKPKYHLSKILASK
jgi:hypothetical protein